VNNRIYFLFQGRRTWGKGKRQKNEETVEKFYSVNRACRSTVEVKIRSEQRERRKLGKQNHSVLLSWAETVSVNSNQPDLRVLKGTVSSAAMCSCGNPVSTAMCHLLGSFLHAQGEFSDFP
jgi:hypothetical protein